MAIDMKISKGDLLKYHETKFFADEKVKLAVKSKGVKVFASNVLNSEENANNLLDLPLNELIWDHETLENWGSETADVDDEVHQDYIKMQAAHKAQFEREIASRGLRNEQKSGLIMRKDALNY